MGHFIYIRQQGVNDEFLSLQVSISLGPVGLSNFISNDFGEVCSPSWRRFEKEDPMLYVPGAEGERAR